MRGRKTHLADPSQSPIDGRTAAACKSDKLYPTTTDDERLVSCPTCLSLIHRRKLAERPADAPDLRLEKFEGLHAYRFAYKAMLGNDHLGFIVYDGAYGRASWKVCSINLPTERNPNDKREVGFELDRDPNSAHSHALKFATKEAALMSIPGLREAGRLSTRAELVIAREQYNRRWEANQERQAKLDAEDTESRAMAREALKTVLDDPAMPLTNAQREGLTLALGYIAPKGGPA